MSRRVFASRIAEQTGHSATTIDAILGSAITILASEVAKEVHHVQAKPETPDQARRGPAVATTGQVTRQRQVDRIPDGTCPVPSRGFPGTRHFGS